LVIFTKKNWPKIAYLQTILHFLYGAVNSGNRPVKSAFSVSKFSFVIKFVELTPVKSPIYIKGTRAKTDFFAQPEIKISRFLVDKAVADECKSATPHTAFVQSVYDVGT
jgi:hypothetical protein